jgi:hypothetical protein
MEAVEAVGDGIEKPPDGSDVCAQELPETDC